VQATSIAYPINDRIPVSDSALALANLSRSAGFPVKHNFARDVLSAAGPIAAFLETAIAEVGGPTVGPPLLVDIVVPEFGVKRVEIPAINMTTHEVRFVTARKPVGLPPTKGRLPKVATWKGNRTATQLLSWEPRIVPPPQL
jgi:hypothetical protein